MDIAEKTFGRLGNRLFQCAYIYAQMRDGIIPDIYLQDPKYFDHYRTEIKQLFKQNTSPIDKIAIHVRRGDYVNNPFYVDLTKTDYYERALAEFKGEKFLVFSDDIAFCEEYFEGDEYEFSYSNESDALNEMAACKGVIMGNSSFSWWGAYLNDHWGSIIAPSQWFSDEITRVHFPTEWKIL